MERNIYIVLVIFLFAGCSNPNLNENASADAKAAVAQVKVSQVVGIGKIEPEFDIIQLSSPVSGIVKKINKRENDSAKAGEIILELDHEVEDAKIKQLVSQVNTQYAQVIADEAAIQEYQAKYDNAILELQRLQKLLTKGAETQQAVDDASTNMQSYQSNLSRLRAIADVSKRRLAETKAALVVSERERDQKIITSPVNGKLLEISTLIGSSIDSKEAFAQISPRGKTIAVCEIDELFADKMMEGQKAWIRNMGSLDTLTTGTVYFTASFMKKKSLFTDQAGEKEDRRVREIKILLDQPAKLLLNARIECVIDISVTQKQ
ncbi:HlyD family secretion protein [Flavihumibacter profundi]|uniref:HlyD family secretion protein n=1 Tax=Flavihumibacter profundi TaxID=2716883 RepID=UPI001CC5F7D7|nr:biotin/lipoyl-binding protein [Flavihumibacter profundi]MBZ5856960.1 biotin/lipoyl-binding protein [Flavihumibacter profundi]